MPGTSKRTELVTMRLPVEVTAIIRQRLEKKHFRLKKFKSVGAYCQSHINWIVVGKEDQQRQKRELDRAGYNACMREYRRKNRASYNASQREYRRRNRASYNAHNREYRRKKKLEVTNASA